MCTCVCACVCTCMHVCAHTHAQISQKLLTAAGRIPVTSEHPQSPSGSLLGRLLFGAVAPRDIRQRAIRRMQEARDLGGQTAATNHSPDPAWAAPCPDPSPVAAGSHADSVLSVWGWTLPSRSNKLMRQRTLARAGGLCVCAHAPLWEGDI